MPGARQRPGEEFCAGTGLAVPCLLDVVDRRDGSMEVWLEDVAGVPGADWSVPRLGDFAYQLGLAQARWGDRSEGPPWLSRRWLRQYSGRLAVGQSVDWHHRAVTEHWPRELRDGLKTLWDMRHVLFDLAERLPGTMCHLDVWPMNLIARGDESVLVDWAFVGWGAIGEDIGNGSPTRSLTA